MPESFVHFHVHSDYTLSKGASKVPALVARAKALGLPALALVDDSNMFGAFEFSKYASSAGIQPIVGVKLWFRLGAAKLGSVIMLAQTEQGYVNICSLLSRSLQPQDDTVSEKAVIPEEGGLDGDMSGVILLTGGRDGVLWQLLKDKRHDDASELMDWLRFVFGDRFYVELCRFGDESKEEIEIEKALIDLAYAAQPLISKDERPCNVVPLIAASEVWYDKETRNDAFEILAAVVDKKSVTVASDDIVPSSARRFHMRSADEMRAMFDDVPEAIDNALALAQRFSFMAKGRKPLLPPFTTSEGNSEADELRKQAREGLLFRLERDQIPESEHKTYQDRLDFELGIIEGMKFPGYFLIVSDFIKWAKDNGIPVGPGRGSGAGSLVAYSLKITDINPLPYGLLFERFLNPERVSMPDFDIDFCQDRREEVIKYVQKKYGSDYVSLIATFGEIKSKTALKDVGRVLRSDDFGGYSFGELDVLTKSVSMNGAVPMTLEESYNDDGNPDFRNRIDAEAKYRVLYDNARKVEGLFRNHGSHAAGVVIAGQPIHELAPVGWDSKTAMPVCQFNMKSAETVGLVKFDFLGLKTLSVIREALENIEKTTGRKIDLGVLSVEDPETYEMLARGEANGVFQFESDGMKRVLRDIKPTRIEDLIAVAALYRPGPMEMIPEYAACKNNVKKPNYPEPVDRTKPFLEETYGIMVYQEQVMQMAQVVAGYSLGGADMLRRAMGKKIPAEMAAQRDKFIQGAAANGIDEKASGELFDLIDKFAGYGFNKSHAAAYGLIAFHTAYLKCHYPAEFMAALLSYEMGDPEKMAKVKEDMDVRGIKMLPPCVNSSWARYVPEKDKDGRVHVRFGLGAIKGISGDLSLMTKTRTERGKFTSLEDFYMRAGAQFTKAQFLKLAEAGAFGELSNNRQVAYNVLNFLASKTKKVDVRQANLFGDELVVKVKEEGLTDVKEWGNIVDREFNAVGFYFGIHPLDAYEARFRNCKVKRKESLRLWMIENGTAALKNKRLGGLVDMAEKKYAKKSGKPYVAAIFAEKNDKFFVNFFGQPDFVEGIRQSLENAKIARRPIIVLADVALQDDRISIFGRELIDAEEMVTKRRGKLTVRISPEAIHPTLDDQKKIRDAKEAVRIGGMTQDECDGIIDAALESSFQSKMTSVSDNFSKWRDDAHEHAVQVFLEIVDGDQVAEFPLEGKYMIGAAEENAIKTFDGIVSFRETV
jgi:DNA polymerase-3 subunit alpha